MFNNADLAVYEVYDDTHGHFIVFVANPFHAGDRAPVIAKWKVNNWLKDRGLITVDDDTVRINLLEDPESTVTLGINDHSFTVLQ